MNNTLPFLLLAKNFSKQHADEFSLHLYKKFKIIFPIAFFLFQFFKLEIKATTKYPVLCNSSKHDFDELYLGLGLIKLSFLMLKAVI